MIREYENFDELKRKIDEEIKKLNGCTHIYIEIWDYSRTTTAVVITVGNGLPVTLENHCSFAVEYINTENENPAVLKKDGLNIKTRLKRIYKDIVVKSNLHYKWR